MRNIFPNIETGIIFLVIISASLWGIKSCRAKSANTLTSTAPLPAASLPNFKDTTASLATPVSPASRRVNVPKAPSRPALASDVSSIDPNTQVMPSQQVMTAPSNPGGVPTSYDTRVVRSKSVTPNVTTEPNVVVSNATPLYVLIAGLNVRTSPNLKARSLGKLKLNDVVYFMNDKTEEATAVHLIDGTEVSAPWFKIKTKRGTEGWVHGSGVDFYKRSPKKNF